MEPWVIIVIVVVAVILIAAIAIIVWAIKTGNWFRQTKVKIDESKSSIDVALTKRYDLLTKSVATVKGYAKHEAETLTNVIAMRSGQNISNMDMKEKSDFANKLEAVSKSLNIVVEKYPDLKADKSFEKLQDEISDCEENLQASRRIFNSNVSIYNQRVVTWPSSIIARHYNYQKEMFFEAEEAKKQDVKIEF